MPEIELGFKGKILDRASPHFRRLTLTHVLSYMYFPGGCEGHARSRFVALRAANSLREANDKIRRLSKIVSQSDEKILARISQVKRRREILLIEYLGRNGGMDAVLEIANESLDSRSTFTLKPHQERKGNTAGFLLFIAASLDKAGYAAKGGVSKGKVEHIAQKFAKRSQKKSRATGIYSNRREMDDSWANYGVAAHLWAARFYICLSRKWTPIDFAAQITPGEFLTVAAYFQKFLQGWRFAPSGAALQSPVDLWLVPEKLRLPNVKISLVRYGRAFAEDLVDYDADGLRGKGART